MKCPRCGNDKWYAQHKCVETIIVDEDNNYIDSVENCGLDYYGEPYGPFMCTKCNHEVDKIK